jgi:hypothetical protein
MKTAKEIPQALSQPQEGTGSGTLPTAAGCRETWIGDVLAVRATEADLQGGPGQVITGMVGLRPRGETKRTMRVFIRLGKPPEDVLETMGSVPMSPRGVPRAERRTREQVRSIHDVPDPRGCTRGDTRNSGTVGRQEDPFGASEQAPASGAEPAWSAANPARSAWATRSLTRRLPPASSAGRAG